MEPAEIFAITRPHSNLLWLYVLRCLLSGPLFPLAFIPCLFRYQTLRYRFDDEGIAVSWGLLFRHESTITYSRIQDIHLSRGLLERWLGLGTVDVQTASGSSSAEISIVGLQQFEGLRDFLYTRMRVAKVEGRPRPSGGIGDVQVLTEIRDELRLLRQELERRRV